MTLSRFLIKSDYLERNGIFGAFFFPPFIVSAKSGMYTNCLSSHLHFFFFFFPLSLLLWFSLDQYRSTQLTGNFPQEHALPKVILFQGRFT